MSARSEAKAQGAKRYYTGTVCPRGHNDARFVSNGRCVACAKEDITNTPRDIRSMHARKSQLKHRDEILKRRRAKRAANLEQCRAKGRSESAKYRATRKTELMAAKRKHYLARKQHIQERHRANYQKNREKRLMVSAAWARANVEKVRAINHAYRARKRNAPGRFSQSDIEGIFVLQRGRCAYCRASIRRNRHIDHIVALINGGSNHPRNIQLLCPSCNTSKQDRDPMLHAQTLGRLL